MVDRDNVIVCGHSRWRAAQKLGLTTVPVYVADKLTPEQVQAYRIADNKTGEIAEWNFDLLPLEIRELQEADFDLSLLGFDSEELDRLLNGGANDTVAAGETDPDAVPEQPDEPVSRRGEIYRLGGHLLMCGDATDAADVGKLTGDAEADLWLTDPPYNVAYESSNGLTIENDDMSDSAFREFLKTAFGNVKARLKPGASFYIFHADSEGYNFRGACHDVSLQVRQCLIWKKNSLVLGRQDFHWIHEPILYGWKRRRGTQIGITTAVRLRSWNTTNRAAIPVHPTMKPVEMLIYLLKNSSQRDEIVLDTFGGSKHLDRL